MNKKNVLLLAFCLICVLGSVYWKFAIPIHHVDIHSELVMLGDLDDDHRWTAMDLTKADIIINHPFEAQDDAVWRIDMNQNGMIDEEDFSILRAIVGSAGDPYAAADIARSKGKLFPRPRELYRYISDAEYRSRPLWVLPYPLAVDSVLDWFASITPPVSMSSYSEALSAAVYSESVRFDQAWRKREPRLLPIERQYAAQKLARMKTRFLAGEKYELLLALMELVEDAETLTVRGQPEFQLKLLTFRDHLREVLVSPLYTEYKVGSQDWKAVLELVSSHLHDDLGLTYDFESLGPPRSLNHLENYLQRTEWQYYKSTTSEEDFRSLIAFAQHDSRYLRAVSRTSPKFTDLNVENHNLPMVLLFREALRIKHGDKKKAAGLLDEAIRIPFAWVKSIPRNDLPGALALDNFLMPGNMEDGADKSRHWNVFGGICLYKSPQESLDLALKREMKDLRDTKYSEDGMREFFRDMIANLNGMYHVMAVNSGRVGS